MTPKGAAAFMAKYTKQYHAGAFGSPLASELEAHPELLHVWEGPGAACCVAVVRRARHNEIRKDWTGRPHIIPRGATIATTVAQCGEYAPPELDGIDFVFAHTEDRALTGAMLEARRSRVATRISASSEIITCWGPRGYPHRTENRADLPTAARLPADMLPQWPLAMRMRVCNELDQLHEWHDDYPFYSDGTWGAVNLRGFNPADPLWGVKPAEMPRKWHAVHPGANKLVCDWTTICEVLPTMRALVEDVGWWRRLERVRLMRMAGRPGGGKLARHTDITDKAAGTRDGQVARFHIPLVTTPSVLMHTWELDGTHRATHLEAWNVYYLDQRKPHAVTNPTEYDRIHLVADVIVDKGVRDRLEQLI